MEITPTNVGDDRFPMVTIRANDARSMQPYEFVIPADEAALRAEQILAAARKAIEGR